MQLIFKLKQYYYALVNVLVFYIHDPKKSSQQQYGLDTIIILVLQMRNLRFRKCKDQNFTAGILVYLTLNISLWTHIPINMLASSGFLKPLIFNGK